MQRACLDELADLLIGQWAGCTGAGRARQDDERAAQIDSGNADAGGHRHHPPHARGDRVHRRARIFDPVSPTVEVGKIEHLEKPDELHERVADRLDAHGAVDLDDDGALIVPAVLAHGAMLRFGSAHGGLATYETLALGHALFPGCAAWDGDEYVVDAG